MKEFINEAFLGEGFSVKRFALWEKYGKKRIYITREDGKKSYGFIDLQNNNRLICDDDLKLTLQPYVDEFFEEYTI